MTATPLPRPSPQLPATVERLVARLVRVLQPDSVLLFGSYASGHASSTSDVDLLIVMPDEDGTEELRRRQRQLAAAMVPRVDLMVASREEVRLAHGERASFLRGAFEHGIVLHPRDAVEHEAVSR